MWESLSPGQFDFTVGRREVQANVISRLIQMRMLVCRHAGTALGEWVEWQWHWLWSRVDLSWNNTEHDPSDQVRKNKNTYRSEDGFAAGRKDRNVKWQELFYPTNRDKFPTGTFPYSPIIFSPFSQILIHFWVFVGSYLEAIFLRMRRENSGYLTH